jgi:hypothetical protein
MFTVKTRILLFAVAGLLSGMVSGMGQFFLLDNQLIQQYYPALVLGIVLYLCGIYVARIEIRNALFSLFILIISCIIGWRISIDVGYGLGGPVPYVTAGALGAFVVAWGWLLSWRIRSNILMFVLIVTVSGTLGGIVFQIADQLLEMKEDVWVLFLFGEWQCILLTGIALAHYYCGKAIHGV